jgi:hypothetical protein
MRSYAAPLGRWLTPDPAGLAAVDPNQPQTWNRYAYALNRPTTFADPFGLIIPNNGRCPSDETLIQTSAGYVCAQGGGGGVFDVGGFGAGSSSGGTGGFVGPTVPNADVQKSFTRLFECGLNSGELIAAVEQNFSNFANYDGPGPLGSNAFADFSPGALFAGETLNITSQSRFGRSGPYLLGSSYNGSVAVESARDASFTFRALPGHVLYPAYITFSAANVSPSEVKFSVNVSAQFSSFVNSILFKYAGGDAFESSIWNNLMDNVQGLCK